MKSILFRTFVFTAFVAASFAIDVDGQTASADPRPMAVIEQPDSPIQLVPAAISAYPYRLKYSNVGDRAVRAFVLVTQNDRFDRLQVHMGSPFKPGFDTREYLNPGKPTRLYFDYVLYDDGTSWGPDKFERSKEIAHFFAARGSAIERLTLFAAVYPNSDDFLQRVEYFGGVTSFDAFGPPKQEKLDGHVRIAWDLVIRQLRNNSRRAKEAGEIADQLEKERPH